MIYLYIGLYNFFEGGGWGLCKKYCKTCSLVLQTGQKHSLGIMSIITMSLSSDENQKGANTVYFVQRQCPSGSQRNIVEQR